MFWSPSRIDSVRHELQECYTRYSDICCEWTAVDSPIIAGKATHPFVRIHSAFMQSSNSNEKGPLIVLIHGTFSASLAFLPTMKYLALNGFDSISIDLPGFGVSDDCGEPDELEDTEELVDWYAQVLLGFFRKWNRHKNRELHVVPHSLSCQLVMQMVCQPGAENLIRQVIFACPAGLIEYFGASATIRGRAFRWNLPQSILRTKFGLIMFQAILKVKRFIFRLLGTPPRYWGENEFDEPFWVKLASCVDGQGYSHLGKFISREFKWKNPTLGIMYKSRVPISVIYGEDDDIIPVEQCILTKHIVRCYVAKCVSHFVPMTLGPSPDVPSKEVENFGKIILDVVKTDSRELPKQFVKMSASEFIATTDFCLNYERFLGRTPNFDYSRVL